MNMVRPAEKIEAEEFAPTLRDVDRDALHVLPLSIIPLESRALHRARLIKNARLQGVVELFDDPDTGSGQLSVDALTSEMGWTSPARNPDLAVLQKLAALPSYDVYSLRISLREIGVVVSDHDALRLSASKVRELTDYMADFTHPLITRIYGSDSFEIRSFMDLVNLFRDPDVKRAREKLQVMANELKIEIDDVPRFLEDYGDIFLSLSYYRQCLDDIEPMISQFLGTLSDLSANHQLRSDANLMKTCAMMEAKVNELMAGITGRFENFDRSTKDMWSSISAERFNRVKSLIKSYHTTIGGVLCALNVKMSAWSRKFPAPDVGGPVTRSEFIMSEMKQGFDRIQKIEDQAPMLSGLSG